VGKVREDSVRCGEEREERRPIFWNGFSGPSNSAAMGLPGASAPHASSSHDLLSKRFDW